MDYFVVKHQGPVVKMVKALIVISVAIQASQVMFQTKP